MSSVSWKDLNNFIDIGCRRSSYSWDNQDIDEIPDLAARYPSDPEAREGLIKSLTESLAYRMDIGVEKLLKTFPKPNDAAWKDIDDNALFSPELLKTLHHLEELQASNHIEEHSYDDYNRLETWEDLSDASRKAVVVILHALNAPDPFQHLCILMYLAQHARVHFSALLDVQIRFEREQFGDYSALKQYIVLTIAFYLFIHILEDVDSGPTCLENGSARNMGAFPRTSIIYQMLFHRHYYVQNELVNPHDWFAHHHDSLHNEFWQALEGEEHNEARADRRMTYTQRCFDVAVVWFCLLKASLHRNDAVGSCDLLYIWPTGPGNWIKEGFKWLGYPFFAPLNTFHRLPPLSPLPTPVLLQNSSIQVEAELQELLNHGEITSRPLVHINPAKSSSLFLKIPHTIHLRIHSFLLIQSILALSTVSSLMHRLCLVSLYKDPFHTMSTALSESDDLYFQRLIKLTDILLSRADIRCCICSFRVRAGIDLNECLPYVPSLGSPLAKSISNITHLNFYFPIPIPTAPASFFRDIVQALELAATQYTKIVSLCLVLRQSPNPNSKNEEDGEESPEFLTVGESEYRSPLLCSLQKLMIIMPDDERCPLPALLCMTVGNELTSLTLEHPCLNDIQTFPICASVQQLSLRTEKSCTKVMDFLQHFPSVRYLTIYVNFNSHLVDPNSPILDLSSSLPHIENLTLGGYQISGRPSTLRKIKLECNYIPSTNCVCESVLAIGMGYHETFSFLSANPSVSWDEVMGRTRSVGAMCPNARSLELRNICHAVNKANLPRFLSLLQDMIPRLEILILSLSYFAQRPRRSDFPVDDDQIEQKLIQKELETVISVLQTYPSLKVVSLTGRTSPGGYRGPFNSRLWARSDGGARMIGEADLPEYVSLYDPLFD